MHLTKSKLQIKNPTSVIKPEVTIKSLPVDVVIMIMEYLPLEGAQHFGIALQLSAKFAVQYFAFDEHEEFNTRKYTKPSFYTFLFKNKSFQTNASAYRKTLTAFQSLDLDIVKEYLEKIKLEHLILALHVAISSSFSDAVTLLLADGRVDPSEQESYSLTLASAHGHLEIVKLLLSDPRVDSSARNCEAFLWAANQGHEEICKLFLSDSRFKPSAAIIHEALDLASRKDHFNIVRWLQSFQDDPSAL